MKIPPQKGFNILPKRTTVAIIIPVNIALIRICIFVYFGLVKFNSKFLLFNIKWVIVIIIKNPMIPMKILENLNIANGDANKNQIIILVNNEHNICEILFFK